MAEETSEAKIKRIIVESRPRLKRENIITVPSIDTVLGDALATIELELIRFRTKVNEQKALTEPEGRLVIGYIKALIDLSREARERAKGDDFSKMSDDELIQILQDMLATRKTNAVK